MFFNTPFTLFDGVNDVFTGNLNSKAFDLRSYQGFYVTAVVTNAAALNGTLKLQRTDDLKNGKWFDLPDTALDTGTNVKTVTANANFEWHVPAAYYPHVRLVWTRTAGSCNIGATLNGKGAH